MTSKDPPLIRLRDAIFDHAPRGLSTFAFLLGAAALISAAVPGPIKPERIDTDSFLNEAPAFALAIGGLFLTVLSLGLTRRIRAAWLLTTLVTIHGILATAFFRPRLYELIAYLALFGVLMIARKSFYRRSSLMTKMLPRVWIVASILVLTLASFVALLIVSHKTGFADASFTDLVMDPDLGVAGRPILVAAVFLALTVLYFGVASPARMRMQLADSEDYARVSNLLQTSDFPRPDNILAFTGDKSIFYGPDGCAAISYSTYAGSSIAMGPPIGSRSAWKETLQSFRTEMEKAGFRPAFYSVPPDLLPDLHDLDYRFEKVGENAILDLPTFSLSGRKREVIRRSRRKLAERAGATFEVSIPPHKSATLARLQSVSDLWLAENGGHEKSFSLGRFDAEYLNRCPVGIVKIGGHTVAFGSLMTTPDRRWAGIDLMRYDPEHAITNTMDFLLVELILWAKDFEYQKFDLAMAPLSGLAGEDASPFIAQIGSFVFEKGERFYNFQGLRRFKQKFNPDWEPRYIAAPGYWTLPILLAQVAFLTNRDASKSTLDEAQSEAQEVNS